ncbi:type II toxin-antitoxin system RelE/ParE family toxin [Methylobacterium hispanicum]|uniref:type II toxin-antitoxin system RelE/ParE family toxin n=1 Tax=Methylobacterium hispanicum TaxID=270350 RepID=UPI0019E0A9F5|nr:type II toxin-antitoxin system RelE/ParE family toxin [Parafilimonas terrae]
MTLRLSRRAALRLRQIGTYLRVRDPQAARGVEQAMRDAFALLAEHPAAGREVHPEVRRFVLPRLPYVIYYRVDGPDAQVTIITVRHTAQKPLW